MIKKEKLLKIMQQPDYQPLLLKDLCVAAGVANKDQKKLSVLLEELMAEGRVICTKKGRYASASHMGLMLGRYQGNEKGFGFFIPEEEGSEDYFVSGNDAGSALDGDTVLARRISSGRGRRSEAEVVRVIHRAHTVVVGTYEKSRNFGFVVPDEKRLSKDLFVSKSASMHAKNGEKVVARIVNYGEKRRNPECEIVEILGDAQAVGVDVLSIIRRYHLTEQFPEAVKKQVKKMPDHVLPEETKGRLDLRGELIFTIDGDDAKDFDDAVSLDILKNGNYRLGVHIADVSHYVTEKSPLDEEAYRRGTSVYLVDRVIPMLPKKLSNGICSLNPDVDRLTFSVFMEVDKAGTVQDYEICKSVIHSKERMTYDNVNRFLEGDAALKERYAYMADTLYAMRDLAKILRDAKTDRGSIDFQFDEPKVILDEAGKPVEIRRYESGVSNGMIEEFMLLANETTARHIFHRHLPFLYRVHEKPDSEKIASFMELVARLGYKPQPVEDIKPKQLQQILSACAGKKEEKVISTILLRSLKKAAYREENLGHFGLALSCYTHFTSPIRRYPDLVVHRVLSKLLSGELSEKEIRRYKKFMPQCARQTSDCEVNAVEAEREVLDLKMVEYMQDKVGQVFDGVISSVLSFGFFVELDNMVEGLVRVANLDDDYYQFDEKRYCLLGEHSGRMFQIGDTVRVKLAKADVVMRQIDFVLDEADQ